MDELSSFWNQNNVQVRRSTFDHTLLAFEKYLQSPKKPQDWIGGTIRHLNNIKAGFIWPTPEMNETSAALLMLKLKYVAAIRLSLNNIGKLSFEYIDNDRSTIVSGLFDSLEDVFKQCTNLGIKKILKYNMSSEKIGIIEIQHQINIDPSPFKIEHYCVGKNQSNASVEISSIGNAIDFERKKLQWLLLVDCSGSMGPEKMSNMKKSLLEIATVIKNKDVSIDVVPFDNGILYDLFPLTKTQFNGQDNNFFQSFEKMVNSLRAQGSTNFTDPLKEAVKKLDKSRESHIILFTDGFANSGLSTSHELKTFVSMTLDESINFHIFGIGESYNSDTCLAMIDGHNIPSDSLFHLTGTESTVEIPGKFISSVLNSFCRYLKIKLSPESSLISKRPFIGWPRQHQTFPNLLFTRFDVTKYVEISLFGFNGSKKYHVLELPTPIFNDTAVDFEVSLINIKHLDKIDENTVKTLEKQHSLIPTNSSNFSRMAKLKKTLDLCNLSQGNQRTINLHNISTNSMSV